MNAREELLKATKGKQIKCASITFGRDWYDESDQKIMLLKINYSKDDFNNFLNSLNFEYSNGFGGQELYGLVWFNDNTWLDRGEYDGSEWWNFNTLPTIPKNLI